MLRLSSATAAAAATDAALTATTGPAAPRNETRPTGTARRIGTTEDNDDADPAVDAAGEAETEAAAALSANAMCVCVLTLLPCPRARRVFDAVLGLADRGGE